MGKKGRYGSPIGQICIFDMQWTPTLCLLKGLMFGLGLSLRKGDRCSNVVKFGVQAVGGFLHAEFKSRLCRGEVRDLKTVNFTTSGMRMPHICMLDIIHGFLVDQCPLWLWGCLYESFFGFERRYSVTKMLCDLGLPTFNTVIHNAQVRLDSSVDIHN